MPGEVRLPEGLTAPGFALDSGFIFWAASTLDGWDSVAAELTDAFRGSRESAKREESFVYVVANDALLGRKGAEAAMVASGLLSAARTAAIEGSRKGWTANVVAFDIEDVETVMPRVLDLLRDGEITGELIHVGPGHVGKALA